MFAIAARILAFLLPALRWIGGLLVRLLNFIAPILTWIGALVVAIQADVFTWLIDAAQWILLTLLNEIDPSVGALFASRPWLPLLPYLDTVNWFIPIYPLGAIILSTYGMVAGLRLLRWVFSVQLLGTGGNG